MSDLFEALRIAVLHEGSSTRLDLSGEIDAAGIDVLRQHLRMVIDAATGDVDVDMSAVVFCDSTGLRELLATRHELMASGRQLRVVNPSPCVARLLELAGVSGLLSPLTTQP